LPIRPAGDDPAPDLIVAASLLAMTRHVPAADVDKSTRSKFKSYSIGFFHRDIA